MAKTKLDNVRNDLMEKAKSYFASQDYEVLDTNSNEICLPVVGEDDEEGYVVITFKVPTGSRDGDPYDGYEMAQDYAIKKAERAQKAIESAKKKAEKIARDEKLRAKKAEQKAKHET